MSRSIKKNMGGHWVCGDNDKQDRGIYHGSERAISRDIIKRYVKDGFFEDTLISDKLINNRIDYRATYSDRYDWNSDGGTYYQYSRLSLRKDLEKILNGGGRLHIRGIPARKDYLWLFYQDYLNHKEVYNMFGNAIFKIIKKKHFKSCEQFNKFVYKNEEKILDVMKKIYYGK